MLDFNKKGHSSRQKARTFKSSLKPFPEKHNTVTSNDKEFEESVAYFEEDVKEEEIKFERWHSRNNIRNGYDSHNGNSSKIPMYYGG